MRRISNKSQCQSEDSCAKILNCQISCIHEQQANNPKTLFNSVDSEGSDSAISLDNELHSDCSSLSSDLSFRENGSDIMNKDINTNDIHEDLKKKLSLNSILKTPCSSTTDSGLGVDVFSSSSEIDIQCSDKTSSIDENEKNVFTPSNDIQETVNLQWEYIFQRDEDGDSILHLLVVQGFYRALSVLIELIPQSGYLNVTNKLWQTPLHLAVLTDQPHIVRRFVVAGAQTDLQDHHGNTPLHLACTTGKLSCVQALLIPVAKEEIKEVRTKYSLSHNYKVPYRLFERRNFEGLSCIHLATLGRHTKVIRYLVFCGADVNAQEGKGGRTALHYATECQKLDLVHFLISSCKANGSIKNYAGFTPQHIALYLNKFNPSSRTYLKLTRLLKQHCGDIFELPMSDSNSDGDQLTDEENNYNCQCLTLCP